MKVKRVSELISPSEIKTWEKGSVITIKAGTGAGKSYFIKNILYAFAKANKKRILFLIHRSNCVNQFQREIEKANKTDVIYIRTYQWLEAMIINKKTLDLSEYDYIVCDEFHYFVSDASFNKTTDISLNKILRYTEATRIFMSATGGVMKSYINSIKNIETIDYELEIKYDFIDKLTFFNKDATMYDFAKEAMDRKEKAIFFIQSAEKAYNLYCEFKDNAIFNCSKSNNNYYKYVNQDKIEDILNNEKFEEDMLITTCAMDAGVNIIDSCLVHIICDVEDIGTIIQCMGRKRRQNDDDKICLYIKNITNKQLGGKESQLKSKIEKADFLRNHTVKEYIEKYPRSLDYTQIIYDDIVESDMECTKKINELMYFKIRCDLFDIQCMLVKSSKRPPKFGYCRYVSKMFGFENYRLIDEEKKADELDRYLNNIIGKKLFKVEKKELINKINVRVNGKQQKGRSNLNDGLRMLKLPYIIISPDRKSFRDENGKVVKEQSHWIVYKESKE